MGLYPGFTNKTPAVPGLEGVGVVHSIGSGVEAVKVRRQYLRDSLVTRMKRQRSCCGRVTRWSSAACLSLSASTGSSSACNNWSWP